MVTIMKMALTNLLEDDSVMRTINQEVNYRPFRIEVRWINSVSLHVCRGGWLRSGFGGVQGSWLRSHWLGVSEIGFRSQCLIVLRDGFGLFV